MPEPPDPERAADPAEEEPVGVTPPGDLPLESAEADALDQRRPVVAVGADPVTTVPLEVPEADLLEQSLDVPLDDELREG